MEREELVKLIMKRIYTRRIYAERLADDIIKHLTAKKKSAMKKEINDLLLKMQIGENCIWETANQLFDLFTGSGSLPISELIKDLGDTNRKFILWHDGGEWIISLEGKEMTNCKTLVGWLSGKFLNRHDSMTHDEAIDILIRHNEWRRGGEGEMVTPEQIGEAIDVVTSANVFTFTTTDPQQAMRWAKADDMACAIWELVYNGWREFKETDYDYERAWQVIHETLEDHRIDVEDIWN